MILIAIVLNVLTLFGLYMSWWITYQSQSPRGYEEFIIINMFVIIITPIFNILTLIRSWHKIRSKTILKWEK